MGSLTNETQGWVSFNSCATTGGDDFGGNEDVDDPQLPFCSPH